MTEYYKTPEKFQAIQFTGGAENGKDVCQFISTHNGTLATYSHTIGGNGEDALESISFQNRDYRSNTWFIKGDQSGRVEVMYDEDFKALYEPGLENAVLTVDGKLCQVNDDGSLTSLNDEAVINNGIIDSVPTESVSMSDIPSMFNTHVTAVQFLGGGASASLVINWLSEHSVKGQWIENTAGVNEHILMRQLYMNDNYAVYPGCWIVRNTLGEWNVYNNEMFERMYNPAEPSEQDVKYVLVHRTPWTDPAGVSYDMVKHSDETVQKAHAVLSTVGFSEMQIGSINHVLGHVGILFRERI